MRKIIRIVFIVIFSAVLLVSAGRFIVLRRQYDSDRDTYSEAASQFTKPSAQKSSSVLSEVKTSEGAETSLQTGQDEQTDSAVTAPLIAPIEIDFKSLTDLNSNIIGWIFCENTVIDYPVVYGVDNSYYLDHDYRGDPITAARFFQIRPT